MKTKKDR